MPSRKPTPWYVYSFINKKDLENLKKYKYAGVDHSFLSKHVMQPYWNALVQLFPLWIAPNLITLLGWLCIVANLFTLLYYSPDLSSPLPSWAYFSFSAGLFIYSSMDAIDGKQARRTGSSSPLGELFDHGCDALNAFMEIIVLYASVGMKQEWRLYIAVMVALITFYFPTWEEFHTHILYLGYINGPVEGTLIVEIIFLIAGWQGPAFFQKQRSLFHYEISLGNALLYSMSLASLLTCVTSVLNVLKVSGAKRQKLSMIQLVSEPLSFLTRLAVATVWFAWSPMNESPVSSMITNSTVKFCIAVGFSCGFHVSQVILKRVTGCRSYPYVDVTLIFPIMGAFHAIVYKIAGIHVVFASSRIEMMFLNVFLWFSISFYFYSSICIIYQICNYLDIYCLKIKQKAL